MHALWSVFTTKSVALLARTANLCDPLVKQLPKSPSDQEQEQGQGDGREKHAAVGKTAADVSQLAAKTASFFLKSAAQAPEAEQWALDNAQRLELTKHLVALRHNMAHMERVLPLMKQLLLPQAHRVLAGVGDALASPRP